MYAAHLTASDGNVRYVVLRLTVQTFPFTVIIRLANCVRPVILVP
jgi:hypothetical protein